MSDADIKLVRETFDLQRQAIAKLGNIVEKLTDALGKLTEVVRDTQERITKLEQKYDHQRPIQ